MPEPSFSVVIPTLNRPAQLARCLESLVNLRTQAEDFEVIVVNDGGDSSLEPVIRPFRRRLNLKLLEQSRGGPAAARNAGAAVATGEFLAFTDDDCWPAPEWLERLAASFSRDPNAAFGGRTINVVKENPYSEACERLLEYLYLHFHAHGSGNHFFASNNLAVPARQFSALGGFDTSNSLCAGEDREFCFRWSQAGHPLVEAPDAVVYHSHALTFGRFCELHFRYGRGAVHYHWSRARHSGRIHFEPLSFYLNMPGFAYRRLQGGPAIRLAGLLLLSQGVHTAGFLWEALRQTTAKHNARVTCVLKRK